jgi:flagellar hook-associated protein 2
MKQYIMGSFKNCECHPEENERSHWFDYNGKILHVVQNDKTALKNSIFKTALMILSFFLLTGFVHSQSTSSSGKVHIPLPGVSEKINSEDIIQKLLVVKKMPIQKKEANSQNYKIENDIVKDLSKYLRDLDTKCRNLYDFQTPFRDMVGKSSDENILEASASRKAKKENYKIIVFQTAKPDSFMSVSLPRNKTLPASDFTIILGENTIKVRFRGGTIYQLATAIEDQAGEKIETKIVNDTTSTSILMISGKETGEKNKMRFEGDLKTLFEAGLLMNGEEKKEEFLIDFSKIVSLTQKKIVSDEKGAQIKASDQGELSLLERNIQIRDNTVLTFNARINRMNQMAGSENSAVSNIEISPMEGVKVSNIEVRGGSLIAIFEEKKEMPPIVSNFTEIFTIVFNDGAIKTYFIDAAGSFTNSLVSYKNKTVEKMILKNNNTDRDIFISDVKISTKIGEAGVVPRNVISRACDALISLDGVEVKRDKNIIEDLIEGVSLNLKSESKAPIHLNVDHNYQKVEDAILAWVDSYNKAMEYLSILTKPNLDRTPLRERSQESLKDGVFQTETTFMVLKNKLRNSPNLAYKTSYGPELAVLEQIGLYTKKAGQFSAASEEWGAAKIGLLNTDSDKLKMILKTKFDGVEQLFASDSSGDNVKDSGVAVSVNQDLRIAIGAGNFIERRIVFNDEKIKANKKEIEEMNRSLDDYEVDLRRKYGKMNQAISESESKQKWLNNQFKGQ